MFMPLLSWTTESVILVNHYSRSSFPSKRQGAFDFQHLKNFYPKREFNSDTFRKVFLAIPQIKSNFQLFCGANLAYKVRFSLDKIESNLGEMRIKEFFVALAMCGISSSLIAQNVGIGTTNPQERLHVAGTVRADQLAGTGTRIVGADANGTLITVAAGATNQVLTQTATGPAWQAASTDWTLFGNNGINATTNFIGTINAADFVMRTSNSERMRVTAAGNVGINTPSPDVRLVVGGDIRTGIVSPTNTGTLPSFGSRIYFSGGNAGATFNSDNSDPIWLARYNAGSDATELRLNLSDNCQASDAFVIQTGGSGCVVSDFFRFDGTGAAYKPGGGAWATLSDRRVKHSIRPFEDGINILKAIEPVGYQYNGLGNLAATDKEYIGVIAQDLQKVAPFMVDDSGEYLRVDPSAFTYILINTVKAQQVQIEALEAQNQSTVERLQKLEAALESIQENSK
jgi:hypothetical protein